MSEAMAVRKRSLSRVWPHNGGALGLGIAALGFRSMHLVRCPDAARRWRPALRF
jgi:hypothetical protein